MFEAFNAPYPYTNYRAAVIAASQRRQHPSFRHLYLAQRISDMSGRDSSVVFRRGCCEFLYRAHELEVIASTATGVRKLTTYKIEHRYLAERRESCRHALYPLAQGLPSYASFFESSRQAYKMRVIFASLPQRSSPFVQLSLLYIKVPFTWSFALEQVLAYLLPIVLNPHVN